MIKSDLAKLVIGELFTGHHPGGYLCERHTSCLGYEGNGAAAARVDLDQVNLVILDRELHVHQANDAESQCKGLGLPPSQQAESPE